MSDNYRNQLIRINMSQRSNDRFAMCDVKNNL